MWNLEFTLLDTIINTTPNSKIRTDTVSSVKRNKQKSILLRTFTTLHFLWSKSKYFQTKRFWVILSAMVTSFLSTILMMPQLINKSPAGKFYFISTENHSIGRTNMILAMSTARKCYVNFICDTIEWTYWLVFDTSQRHYWISRNLLFFTLLEVLSPRKTI